MSFNEFVNISNPSGGHPPPTTTKYYTTKFYPTPTPSSPQEQQQQNPPSPNGSIPYNSLPLPPHLLQPISMPQPHTPLYSLDSRHKFSPYTTLARPSSPIQKNSGSSSCSSPSISTGLCIGQTQQQQQLQLQLMPGVPNRYPQLVDANKQEAKNIADMLQEIIGLEKIRWQSILQGTRGPEVGDRETQRRVKEAEILGARLFGGDLDKLLGSLLNQHLDFLVYYVKNTLCTPKRRHKKIREMLWRSLSTVRDKELSASTNNVLTSGGGGGAGDGLLSSNSTASAATTEGDTKMEMNEGSAATPEGEGEYSD